MRAGGTPPMPPGRGLAAPCTSAVQDAKNPKELRAICLWTNHLEIGQIVISNVPVLAMKGAILTPKQRLGARIRAFSDKCLSELYLVSLLGSCPILGVQCRLYCPHKTGHVFAVSW